MKREMKRNTVELILAMSLALLIQAYIMWYVYQSGVNTLVVEMRWMGEKVKDLRYRYDERFEQLNMQYYMLCEAFSTLFHLLEESNITKIRGTTPDYLEVFHEVVLAPRIFPYDKILVITLRNKASKNLSMLMVVYFTNSTGRLLSFNYTEVNVTKRAVVKIPVPSLAKYYLIILINKEDAFSPIMLRDIIPD